MLRFSMILIQMFFHTDWNGVPHVSQSVTAKEARGTVAAAVNGSQRSLTLRRQAHTAMKSNAGARWKRSQKVSPNRHPSSIKSRRLRDADMLSAATIVAR